VALITDPTLIFTVMVVTTLVMPLLAEKLRIPDMVLLLLSGALLGPHGLGLLERNSAIMLFSSVGLLYIMFLAGLEIDLHQFIQSRNRSLVFGLLTFSIPQGLGTLLGRYVLSMDWPEAILLASMFASHTLLAYPVASRLGIARSESVAVTIGATIITDIMALMVLAVIADAAKGIALTPLFWIEILASLGVLVAVGWWGIPWLSRWFFRNNSENGGAQFLFVLGTVCAFAYASHYARMEPIIGAFLAGIAFNRLIPRHGTLMNRVEFVGHTVFIPFFLISVGMLVNLGDLARDTRSWLVAATMVCGVIVTKYLAAQAARRLFGYGKAEGQVMFGLSVVQAAATLAAALVGFELKIFDVSVLNGAVAMIMVTCPLGSWAVERYGRYVPAEPVKRAAPSQAGQRLLIPVVNLVGATRLLDLAFVLRDDTRESMLHPLTVIPDASDTSTSLAEGEKLMARCLAHAASAEIPLEPRVRISNNVSDGIIRAVQEMRVGLAMFGWGTNKTVASRIFGTVRTRMLQDCPSRLLFCRIVMPLNTTRRLLLLLPPLAGRRTDIEDVLCESKRLAQKLGAELQLYLCEPSEAEHLSGLTENAKPEVPLTLVTVADWFAARNRMFNEIQPDDMVILPMERPMTAFWTPSMDRLPDLMAHRYPRMNLLVAYPALLEEGISIDYEVEESPDLARIIPVALANEATRDEALKTMTGRVPGWTETQQKRAYRLLQGAAGAYPVEMAPGTVLLHTHSESVDETTLLIGVGDAGWRFPGIDLPARVILSLISPVEKSPEHHLAALSQLARAFREGSLSRNIQDGSSADDIARSLREITAKVRIS